MYFKFFNINYVLFWALSAIAMGVGCRGNEATGSNTTIADSSKIPQEVIPSDSDPEMPNAEMSQVDPSQSASLKTPSAEELAQSEQLVDLADQAYLNNDIVEFERLLREAVELGNPRAMHNLGVLHQNRRAYLPALELFEEAIRVKPNYDAPKLELARDFAEGWTRPIDYKEAISRFEQLMNSGELRIKQLSRANLGIMALYGLGAKHSLSDARKFLGEAAELGLEEAKILLEGLPDELEVWPGAVPEPENGWVSLRVGSGDYLGRPQWARYDRNWRDYIPPKRMSGTFIFEQTIAVGVPGELDDNEEVSPGSMKRSGFLEWKPGKPNSTSYMQYRTWHTNSNTCEGGMFVVGIEGDVITLFGNDSITTYDVRTGKSRSAMGCFLRVKQIDGQISFLEEWPRNCTQTECSGRGSVVGKTLKLTPTDRTVRDISDEEDAVTVAQAIFSPPSWAVPDKPMTKRKLKSHLGVFSKKGMMAVLHDYDDNDEPVWKDIPVVDKLRICKEKDDGVRFTLETWGVNGHACIIEGTPAFNTDGELILITAPENYLSQSMGLGPSGLQCTLHLKKKKGAYEITNVWPAECNFGNCGARAHPMGARFPMKSRKRSSCNQPYENPFWSDE